MLRRRYPLWQYRDPGPERGKIYLPGVKTFVYTTERTISRTGVADKRQARVTEILTALKFRDWQWFVGKRTPNYYSEIWKGHIQILQSHELPVLILEDDIEPRGWQANITVPAGCQAAQLGGGRGGRREGVEAGIAAGLPFRRQHRYGYIPIDDEWMRITGMWFTHAILWLDREVAADMCRRWQESRDMIDNVTAFNQWRYFWACRRVPMFWQNDGHHFRDTYRYAPPGGPT